jgi:acetoin utilization deacetylase AcuC-like enzyme
MIIFSDPSVTAYEAEGHPEAPWRVSRSAERLTSAGLPPRLPDVRATEADVLRVHTTRHWLNVRTGGHGDPDTPHFPGIEAAALASLSGALSAMTSALAGTPAFSLMRPPGHHAGAERVAGFCYVNNIASACAAAGEKGRRIAILDVDVHHGDGTEELAFEREGWLFASLHQSPLYPGTGLVSQANCLNYPLPPGTDEVRYLLTLESALARIADFKPGLLAVSAGFDTYKHCPLAQMRLEKGTYKRVGRLIAETGLPRFAVLEGGYAADLPELIENFVQGFAG